MTSSQFNDLSTPRFQSSSLPQPPDQLHTRLARCLAISSPRPAKISHDFHLPAKPMNRQRTPRQQERRARILEAARTALSENGYEGLNMRDLAVAAEVSPTTLYNQFENKDTLLLAALSEMLQHIDLDVGATEARGIARVLARAEAVTTQMNIHPAYADAMTLMLINASPDDLIVQILLNSALGETGTRIDEMLALGEVRSDCDREALLRRLATGGWAAILLWQKRIIPPESLGDQYRENLLASLWPVLTEQAQDAWRWVFVDTPRPNTSMDNTSKDKTSKDTNS